jgi:hypothetical protein
MGRYLGGRSSLASAAQRYWTDQTMRIWEFLKQDFHKDAIYIEVPFGKCASEKV